MSDRDRAGIVPPETAVPADGRHVEEVDRRVHTTLLTSQALVEFERTTFLEQVDDRVRVGAERHRHAGRGEGAGRADAVAAAGVPMALGSDSHAVIDLFEEGRALELDERLRSQGRGVHAAIDLLDMATANGHRCLGWDDAGAIAVGHRADLVSVSLGSVRTAGARDADAIEATVFAASAGDVTDVVVDGRRIVTAGRHVDIDVASELHAAITELMDR